MLNFIQSMSKSTSPPLLYPDYGLLCSKTTTITDFIYAAVSPWLSALLKIQLVEDASRRAQHPPILDLVSLNAW